LAYLCAHELTHVIAWEHIGLNRFARASMGMGGSGRDRPVDTPMKIKYGSYPRYRLLVTYFIEKKGLAR
jgi:hypothetical protein